MQNNPSPTEQAGAIGELKGLLQGIRDMMADQNASMNRRMDDMHHSNTRRLDDLTNAVNQRLTKQDGELQRVEKTADDAKEMAVKAIERIDAVEKRAGKSGGVAGAGTGALIAGGIELIKAVWGGIGT